MQLDQFYQILDLIFPKELLKYFELKSIDRNYRSNEIFFSFEERLIPPELPEQFQGQRVISKGFNSPKTIQDFPLRGKKCTLLIKRRKWKIEGRRTIFSRQLNWTAEEMKLTRDFADFLKAGD